MPISANPDIWHIEGMRARKAGLAVDACPYHPGTAGECHWKQGWKEADAEADAPGEPPSA